MIYTSARFADEAHTLVSGTDSLGNSETVPLDHTLFRQPDDGPQGFLARGGVIEPYAAPAAPLADLEPWRFWAMLDLSGKKGDLLTFIENLPDPQKIVAKAKLEYSLVFRRDNDLVLQAQQALGLTDEQLDGLWAQALEL